MSFTIEKCAAETVYKIAKVLDTSMEALVESGIHQDELEAKAGKAD